MGKGKIIAGTLAGLIMAGGIAGGIVMAVPKTRNAIMDGIAKNSTIYKSAMDNNSKLEQDYKSKSDRVSELETIQANLRLEIEKVKNDAKLNDEEKSAKIADLQKQLDLASATGTVTLTDVYENIVISNIKGVDNSLISKKSSGFEINNSEFILASSKFVNALQNLTFNNISVVDINKFYTIKIPGSEDCKKNITTRLCLPTYDSGLIPTINTNCKDDLGNDFDFSSVNIRNTYKVICTGYNYSFYNSDELASAESDFYKNYYSKNGENSLIKELDLNFVITIDSTLNDDQFVFNTNDYFYYYNGTYIYSRGDSSLFIKNENSSVEYMIETYDYKNVTALKCSNADERITLELLSDDSLKYNDNVYILKPCVDSDTINCNITATIDDVKVNIVLNSGTGTLNIGDYSLSVHYSGGSVFGTLISLSFDYNEKNIYEDIISAFPTFANYFDIHSSFDLDNVELNYDSSSGSYSVVSADYKGLTFSQNN